MSTKFSLDETKRLLLEDRIRQKQHKSDLKSLERVRTLIKWTYGPAFWNLYSESMTYKCAMALHDTYIEERNTFKTYTDDEFFLKLSCNMKCYGLDKSAFKYMFVMTPMTVEMKRKELGDLEFDKTTGGNLFDN